MGTPYYYFNHPRAWMSCLTSLFFRWMYIAMAASCAIDLGLHQDALEWVDRRKMSLEQYGARNNLWWGVYAYASLWGLYVGRPSLFQGQDVTCAHPSLRPESSFSRDLSTLLQITNTMTQELYSGTQFMAAPSLSTGECHKRLLEWHGGLASNNSLDAELNPVPSPHVILLQCVFFPPFNLYAKDVSACISVFSST